MNSQPTIDLDAMRDAAGEASELLKSLAHPNRLMILCHLTEGECSVGELAAALEIRDTVASQHLALLRKDGLVRTRREGQTIWYSLEDGPARQILAALAGIFCPAPRRRGARR